MKNIKKAVIPAAGLGTRLLPATKAVPKAFLPVLSREGRVIPGVQAILEDAINGGVERVALIVSPEDEPFFRRYFLEGPSPRLEKAIARCSAEVDIFEGLEGMASMIDIIVQEEPEGFGHAVAQAAEWVGNEPFLLLLGDHIYRSRTAVTCTVQLLRVSGELGVSTVGVSRIAEEEIFKYGVVTGELFGGLDGLYRLSKVMEKPDVGVARDRLTTPGLPEGEYLTLFGIHALQPEIFSILKKAIAADRRFKGEIQLTTALDELRASSGLFAYEIAGEWFDVGDPVSYHRAFGALAERLD